MYLKELTNEEFTEFTNSFIQNSIYQTTEYAFVMNKQGLDSLFVGLIDEENKIVGATLLLLEKKFGFKYAYAPRGFLLDYTHYSLFETFTKLIKKYLGKKDVIAVKICPMIVKNIYNKDNQLIGKNKNEQLILSYLKKLGYYHLGYNNYFEALKPRFECIVPLNKPDYKIFMNFKRGLRNKIRNAVYKNVKVVKGTKEDIQNLYLEVKDTYPRNLNYFDDCYDAFSRNNSIEYYYAIINTEGFLKASKTFYEMQEKINYDLNQAVIKADQKKRSKYINKKLNADIMLDKYKRQLIRATNLLRDSPNGIIIASALIIKLKDTIYLLMDGYDKEFKEFNGKHILFWSIMQKYAKLGYTSFNLGGVTNVTLNENSYQGLNDFKTSFGGDTFEYIGDFELITNQGLYFMYKNAAPLRNIFKK